MAPKGDLQKKEKIPFDYQPGGVPPEEKPMDLGFKIFPLLLPPLAHLSGANILKSEIGEIS